MNDRPCYEVEFSDGTVLVADEQHQWLTDIDGQGAVRTTGEIAGSIGARHQVANTRALQFASSNVPVDPYALAASLTVGATVDPELRVGVADLVVQAENKRIPAKLLRGSESERRELLAGMLDAAASVAADGEIRLETRDPSLSDDVAELVVGLGYDCHRAESGVAFYADDDVFQMHRKALRHKQLRGDVRRSRRIVDMRKVDSVPVRCVEVDNADHLYLAGRSMIPTHNSTLGMDFLRSCSVKHGMASVMFSLEMSKTEIVMRLLSAEAKIKLGDMRSGKMTDDDWTKLARRMSEISEAPLFIDDSPNLTMMEIRAKARRLKQKHDIKLIVIDYLQLMSSGKKVESRQQEVSEFSRSLKLLAKELEVPVVAICQLNRGPEQRQDKRPQVADLRESGSLEQDADMVILLYRPDATERDDPRGGEADLILGKHRNGPTATITVAHQLHLSKFVDMARG